MISRINSPYQLGRMNQIANRKAEDGGWWLAGGISPANCVAAYQPKGAASYAVSKVNLNKPGTHDAFEGSAPGWSAINGWTSNGINTSRLLVDWTPSSDNFTFIARGYKILHDRPGYDWNTDPMIESVGYVYDPNYTITTSNVGFRHNISGRIKGVEYARASTYDDNVIAVAAGYLYTNGVAYLIATNSYYPNGQVQMAIFNSTGAAKMYCGAIYNVVLSAEQIAALTAAMAAL